MFLILLLKPRTAQCLLLLENFFGFYNLEILEFNYVLYLSIVISKQHNTLLLIKFFMNELSTSRFIVILFVNGFKRGKKKLFVNNNAQA